MAKQIETNHNHMVYCPRCKRKIKWQQLVKCPACAFEGCEECGWKRGERCRPCIEGTRDKLPPGPKLTLKEEWDKWAASREGRRVLGWALARSAKPVIKSKKRPATSPHVESVKSKRRPPRG